MDSDQLSGWWGEGQSLNRTINSKISGDPANDWLDYTLHTYYAGRLPLTDCLSIGCGSGETERRLAHAGIFTHCDAYESLGEAEVQIAIDEANADGYDQIKYHVVSMEQLVLPPDTYEFAYTRDSLQHIEPLESILHQIRQSLKPTGFLVINGYVGPNRFQFPNNQKSLVNLCLGLVPKKYRQLNPASSRREGDEDLREGLSWWFQRLIDKIKDGDLLGTLGRRLSVIKSKTARQGMIKRSISFPTLRDVLAYDSSLAVRSGEICHVLEQEFDIVERKDWGGNIMQFLLPGISHNFSDDDPQSQAVLRMLINIEDTLIATGELTSDYAYVVAKARRT